MIYVLEDETSIRKLVLYTLNSSGLEAKGCATAEEFWESMREEQPQLVLLDIMLPGEDGLSVLKKLRAAPATAKLPVMMLTAKSTEYDKVLGLDMGADDYLPKPFGMMELAARVRSLLRRAGADTKVVEYAIGGLYVSIPRHLVTAEGVSVNLTLKEFEVLAYLLANAGIVLTRDQIMSAVWGYDFDGESRTVDVHIRTLRAKLGTCADLIQTVRGVGYRIGGGE
ncbi:Alkaline phosphatase synthesis transcriptional regulatory protein PhoP [bioreactor metagenome]|uniref:Alkaline phosphatase synthesis transcriptional regulatory protein PhoP n=1 Tax=bioreactor metagenome TaxID=1076179 RepID=A0A645ATD1_9ZZZZ